MYYATMYKTMRHSSSHEKRLSDTNYENGSIYEDDAAVAHCLLLLKGICYTATTQTSCVPYRAHSASSSLSLEPPSVLPCDHTLFLHVNAHITHVNLLDVTINFCQF